jgi:hypothetical protein
MATDHASIIEQIADPNVPISKLRNKVTVDPSRSRPFTPSVVIDTTKVKPASAREALAPTGGSVGDAFTRRRQEIYRRKIAAGWKGLRFVSEGDSWFQYPLVLRDIIDWLSDDYAILDFAAAGDTLANMKRGILNIVDTLKLEKSHGFLLSGGGNDLLDGGRLKLMLRPYTSDHAGGPLYRTAQDYIIMHRLDEYLREVIDDYRDFFEVLTTQLPELKIFCHGYDWMLPRSDGIYLWPTMQELEIQDPLRSPIIKVMVDLFNERLQQLAGNAKYQGNVIYVDCRNTVGNKAKWFDEIHPRDPGFGRVASRFKTAIDAALKGVA